MPIVTPPTVVHNAMDAFIAKFFTNQPQRDHAARYLTGLMICSNKTITGMTSEQPNASDPSCLNRFMTGVDWDAQKLNEERIAWLQNFDDMKFHERGIIAIDDVLIEKSGKHIKDSGTFWDHSESRYMHAQDLIIINYVHPKSGKHYPLEFRRFKKEEQCQWTSEEFKKMTELSLELLDGCHEKGVLGTFTFDSFYSSSEILNHIDGLKNVDGTSRGYVADLKFNRKTVFKGVEQQVVVRENDPAERSQASDVERRHEAMVLERVRKNAERRPQGSHRDLVALQERCRAAQDTRDEPHFLERGTHRSNLSRSLDGHGNIPPRRQAGTRPRRLSVERRRRPNQAYLFRLFGVQSFDAGTARVVALVAPNECEWMGLRETDDDRRKLPCDAP